MLPNLTLLEQIQQGIKLVPNHRKESKRLIHYCLFLLGYKAGVRVSEAINFDLNSKIRKGLYQSKLRNNELIITNKQLKTIAKTLYQWHKINSYQKLEKTKKN